MHINHLGISGGKDSTALLLWAVHESGYPIESIRATFADTGNECNETLDYVRMLSEKVHPIEWIKPERDFFELAKHKGRFPSATVRFCTTMLKMQPSKEYCYRLLEEGHEVLLHTGVRAAESAKRAALLEKDWDEWFALPVYRPLLRWSIDDVWAIHAKYRIPRNPLYDLGMKRVGCAPCIMSQKTEIRLMAMLFPERFDRIREEEKAEGIAARDINSFFSPDKVPKFWRSQKVTTKDGRQVSIATINDVVAWSQTTRGGKQVGFDFGDEPETCSHTSGACE